MTSNHSVPANLTHEFADLNPFRARGDEGGEEEGSLVPDSSIAGGGLRFTALHQQDLAEARQSDPYAPLPKKFLPVSYILRH